MIRGLQSGTAMRTIDFLVRLEPRSRGASLAHGVATRVHDTLWLLSRQLTVGELEGDSGGTLVEARVPSGSWMKRPTCAPGSVHANASMH
jgi:hypothetical protein